MIPICLIGDFNMHAVEKAVGWWGEQGIHFVVEAEDNGNPGIDCVAVMLHPSLADLGLRGLTVQGEYVPVIGIAHRGDAKAIAHELGHAVLGSAHDNRKHHIMSSPHPGWRR